MSPLERTTSHMATGERQLTSTYQTRPLAEPQLIQLADDAAHCQRCPLYRNATQTVFGEGPIDAALLLVGEQPGDQEDREGRPFVGPAGRILDLALEKAGLDRRSIYVTNAVKHFKYEQRGKRRLHKHPNRDAVEKCRWWLDQELVLVKPRLVIALGALAARALMGRTVILSRERGRLLHWANGRQGLATIHPSAVLRMPDEASRQSALSSLVRDFRQALLLAEGLSDIQ
jgi:uracil-DNA glycosylase family protein